MQLNIVSLSPPAGPPGRAGGSGASTSESDTRPTARKEAARSTNERQEVTRDPKAQEKQLEELAEKAQSASSYFALSNTHLEFKVSEQDGRIVVNVIDTESSEIVRQIPPESFNRLAGRMSQAKGLLFEARG